jgi:hypothetical protein
MTNFQTVVVEQLRQLGKSFGIELVFETTGAHACSRFTWRGREAILLVADGELILELDGEHYFETPLDPEHERVGVFLRFVRLCLEGHAPRAARKEASAGHAS